MILIPEIPTATELSGNPDELRREITANIRKLQALSNKGIWAMALFLLICIGAWHDFAFLPSFPAKVKEFLGKPPSANMISAALVLYTFSAILLILARMTSGSGEYGGFSHVAYLAGFFTFYHFSGVLTDNFWAVFAAGITVLALESYHIWTYCAEELRKEQENLTELDRKTKEGWWQEGK